MDPFLIRVFVSMCYCRSDDVDESSYLPLKGDPQVRENFIWHNITSCYIYMWSKVKRLINMSIW